jgi:O-antigen/teichoic acid export membrane protein
MKRRLVTNAAASVIQVLLSGAAMLLLYRFLLARLGAESLGVWAVLLATTSISRLSELGVSGSVVPFVSRFLARADSAGAISVIETAVLTTIGATSVLLLVAYPLIRLLLGLVLSPSQLPIALHLLPYALASLLISMTAGVYQSALDAMQRLDLRAAVTTSGSVCLLLATFGLAPRYGLLGVTLAQICQALVMLLSSIFLVHRGLPALPLIPLRWSAERFREIVSYGANLQAATVFGLLYEPIIKLLLTHFSGVTVVAYYEMANRLVQQVRALVVSAGQALTPLVSRLHDMAPAEIPVLYRRSCEVLIAVAMPIYSALIGLLPITMWLWVGHDEPIFLFAGVVLSIASFVNVLTVPSYYFNMGMGALRWNTVAHLVIGVLSAGLGWIFGTLYSERGVIVSGAIALMTGSAVLIVSFHRLQGIPLRVLTPKSRQAVFVCIGGACALWLLFGYLHGRLPMGMLLTLEVGCAAAVFGSAVWQDPSIRRVLLTLGESASASGNH